MLSSCKHCKQTPSALRVLRTASSLPWQSPDSRPPPPMPARLMPSPRRPTTPAMPALPHANSLPPPTTPVPAPAHAKPVPPPTRCDGSKQVANACRVARVGIACAAVYPVAFALRSRFLLCDGRSVPLLFFCMVRTSAGSAAPVPCSAFLKLLWRCQCAGSALPAQWPACHFAPWLPPRAMGDGAAQAPVAWHLWVASFDARRTCDKIGATTYCSRGRGRGAAPCIGA